MSLPVNPPPEPVSFSPNARTVLEKRYLVKNEKGQPVEQPEDLFWRVASVGAGADRRYGAREGGVQAVAEEFYALMTQRRFEPNSPTLMNAGRPLGQLSACFVLPVEDALSNKKNGIYDTLGAMALIHQSGGGTGFSFSRLRGKGSMVRSTTGVASGPVSFMKLYDASTDAVKQGGTRRGANMGILRVDHPDIVDFITCKEDLTQITNFNISVAVTDKFMDAVKAGTKYDLVDPSSGKVTGQLDARGGWDKMIDGAWRTGEPGCFFIDEANRFNPVPHVGQYEATNPCGEQPLLPYDVCNLGSINVGYYVQEGVMDWDALKRDIHLSVHFLDNIIDVNKYPLPEIDALSKRIRRIGFGVMGFADALVRLASRTTALRASSSAASSRNSSTSNRSVRASASPTSVDRSLSGLGRSGVRTKRARVTREEIASAQCRCCATVTSTPSLPPARSRSSPAARQVSSHCLPSLSCAIRP